MSGGVWHRTLVYLGLKEEPEEGYDEPPERLSSRGADGPGNVPPSSGGSGSASNVRPLRDDDTHVRAVPSPSVGRTAVVEVRAFDDVESIGGRYRTGQAVVFDVSRADASTSRRVIDFVSGLTYASRGELTRLGRRSFLLMPAGVSVSAEEQRRLADLGYEIPSGREA